VSSLSDRFSPMIRAFVGDMLGILVLVVAVPLAVCVGLVERLSPRWRERQRRHEAAWQGFTDPGPDGYSRLQNECREIVAHFASDNGYRLNEEQRESHPWGGDDTRGWELTLRIEELETTVWLLSDEVHVRTPTNYWPHDRWYHESPAHMERWLAEELNALVLP